MTFGTQPPARPAGVVPRQWNVADRAQRLDAIRGGNLASEGYRRLHALETFAAAHGGFATANLHIAETADGNPTVVWKEKGTEYALPQLFGVVVGLAFDLIWAVWRESGLDLSIPVGAVSKSTSELSELG